MTFSGFSFCCWRIWQIVTLIPTVGMLAWFVDYWSDRNQLTARYVLILFIVSVLGLVWASGTLFLYTRAKHSAGFVAFVDALFFGAFIGAVYDLRRITKYDCNHVRRPERFYWDLGGGVTVTGPGVGIDVKKPCSMLKAAFAFGIMNVVFFALTFFFALLVHRHYDSKDKVVVKRETHVSRHRGHRSRSPRHSHHSSRRSYHV